jgi:hypothetical protein
MAKTSLVYDKNGTPVTIDGVESEYTTIFQLVHGSTVQEIAEPSGWGDAEMVLERDADYHGFHYEYINGETSLLFTCDHGRHLIEEVYEAERGDGEIYLRLLLTGGAEDIVKYEGRLNLNTYENLDEGVTCQIERKSLHELVQSRWDTPLDLFSNKSLDDTTISTFSKSQLTLHSMAIRERYENVFPPVSGLVTEDKINGVIQLQPQKDVVSPQTTAYHILPNLTTPTINEIKTANDTQTLYILNQIYSDNGSPLAEAFNFVSGGTFDLELKWNLDIALVVSRKFLHGNTLIEHLSLKGKIRVVPLVGAVTTYNMSGDEDITINARETGLQNFTGEYLGSITVKAGDKLIISVEADLYDINHSHLRFVEFTRIQTNSFSLKLEGATLSSQSATQGLTLGEATLQALRVVTGINDPLRAPILGIQNATTRVAGEASNYFVTNGFQLRKFDSANRPLKPSLSELITSQDALFCIGMQYDETDTGQYVKIMPAKDFYAGGEIMYIESCSDYKEKADNGLFYNQHEYGFEKYIDDPVAIGNLDEYCTRHERQTPIRTEKMKWTKLSKLVGSGYAIEQTRREQFANKPNDSTQFDDSNFVIAFIPGSGGSYTLTIPLSFNGLGTNNYIIMGDDYIPPSWMVVGMALTVSGTFANNRVFTITKLEGNRIYVLETVNTSLTYTTATISAYNYIGKAEKDEPFESVTNLFGSETAYNLRRTPLRCYITHSPFFLSGLKSKPPTAKIKSTFVKNNGLLTTKLKATEPYPLGDVDFAQWTENQEITLESLQGGERIFSPEFITFRCQLTKAEIHYLRRALLGKTATSVDYGYVSVNNNKGEKVSGYPMQIKYSENSEECSIKLRKK